MTPAALLRRSYCFELAGTTCNSTLRNDERIGIDNRLGFNTWFDYATLRCAVLYRSVLGWNGLNRCATCSRGVNMTAAATVVGMATATTVGAASAATAVTSSRTAAAETAKTIEQPESAAASAWIAASAAGIGSATSNVAATTAVTSIVASAATAAAETAESTSAAGKQAGQQAAVARIAAASVSMVDATAAGEAAATGIGSATNNMAATTAVTYVAASTAAESRETESAIAATAAATAAATGVGSATCNMAATTAVASIVTTAATEVAAKTRAAEREPAAEIEIQQPASTASTASRTASTMIYATACNSRSVAAGRRCAATAGTAHHAVQQILSVAGAATQRNAANQRRNKHFDFHTHFSRVSLVHVNHSAPVDDRPRHQQARLPSVLGTTSGRCRPLMSRLLFQSPRDSLQSRNQHICISRSASPNGI